MMIRSQFPCSRFVCFGVVGRRERIWMGMAAHLLHLVTALAFLNLDVVPTTEITAGARRYGFPSGKYTPTKHGCKLSQLPVHGDALLHIEVPFSWTWPCLPGTDLHPVMPRAMNLSTVDFYGSLAYIGTHSVIAPTIPLQSSQGRRCRTVGLPHRQSAVMAQSKQTERVFWQFANASSSPAMTVNNRGPTFRLSRQRPRPKVYAQPYGLAELYLSSATRGPWGTPN